MLTMQACLLEAYSLIRSGFYGAYRMCLGIPETQIHFADAAESSLRKVSQH